MFGIINFEAFVLAGILLNLTPGADTMYILGRSISQGKKSGILSALGIACGALIHCLFAALGLSILLAESAFLFHLIKYLGALYLIYLGIQLLRSKSSHAFELKRQYASNINYRKVFFSGMLTNILNPKVALFFLAFLPQFINPEFAQNHTPFIILGLTFVTTGTIWCLLLAFFSAKLANSLKTNYKIKSRLDKCTGAIFILLGVKLAFTKQ